MFQEDPIVRFPVSINKPTTRGHREVLDEQWPAAGDIALFWATYANESNYPVGLWRVHSYSDDGNMGILAGDPNSIVLFPEKQLSWIGLDNRLSRVWGAETIRLLEPEKLGLVLDEFTAAHRTLLERDPARLDARTIERNIELMEAIRLECPDPSSSLGQRIVFPPEFLSTLAAPREADVSPPPTPVTVADDAVLEAGTEAGDDNGAGGEEGSVALSTFPKDLVEDYRIALSVSSLVLLAGPSGVGKTQLTVAFARNIGAAYELVSVRPDWRTNEDLLGYLPPFGDTFVATAFSRFVRAASDEEDAANAEGRLPTEFHLCLDEMNLARPEYYLAEVLSKMELDGELRYLQLYDAPAEAGFPRRLRFPRNIRVIGTVNNDDTTFPLSAKVLDRCVYLTFDTLDLPGWFDRAASPSAKLIRHVVVELDSTLRPSGIRIGYRVAGQLVRWVDEATKRGAQLWDALDAALSMLVLCKLRFERSNPAHRACLRQLTAYLEGLGSPEDEVMRRSIARLTSLSEVLERNEFAFGQLET